MAILKHILCGFKPDGLRTLKCFPPGKRFNRYGLFDRKLQFPADFCLLFAFPPTLPVHRTEDFLRVDYRTGNLAFVFFFLLFYEKTVKAHCRKSGKATSICCFCFSRAPHTVGCHPVQCRMLRIWGFFRPAIFPADHRGGRKTDVTPD